MSTQIDLLEQAFNPPAPIMEYFGQLSISVAEVMLVEGYGRQPYDDKVLNPKTGEPYTRNVAVDVSIEPLPEMKLDWPLERKMLNWSNEWKKHTLPSIKAMGIDSIPKIAGAWVRAETVPTGRTYTKIDQNGTSSERDATAIVIKEIYPDEAACRAAFANRKPSNGASGAPAAYTATPAPQTPPTNGDKNRVTALAFAKLFVKNALRDAGGDLVKAQELLTKTLAGQPLVSQYFTAESPEIMEMLAAGGV